MNFEIIGKCSPYPDEIKRLVDDGFTKAELYVREENLTEEFVKNVIDAKKEYGIEFYSIHTPHSKPEVFVEIMKKTKEFANRTGIKVVVVHSEFVDVFSEGVIRNLGENMFPENSYAVAQNSQDDFTVLEKALKNNVKICLDTAHLWVSSIRTGRNFYTDLETIFREYSYNIGHVHLADAGQDVYNDLKETNDKNIEEGMMDFFTTLEIINRYYKGVAVVETWMDAQKKDLNRLNEIEKILSRKGTLPEISHLRQIE